MNQDIQGLLVRMKMLFLGLTSPSGCFRLLVMEQRTTDDRVTLLTGVLWNLCVCKEYDHLISIGVCWLVEALYNWNRRGFSCGSHLLWLLQWMLSKDKVSFTLVEFWYNFSPEWALVIQKNWEVWDGLVCNTAHNCRVLQQNTAAPNTLLYRGTIVCYNRFLVES